MGRRDRKGPRGVVGKVGVLGGEDVEAAGPAVACSTGSPGVSKTTPAAVL